MPWMPNLPTSWFRGRLKDTFNNVLGASWKVESALRGANPTQGLNFHLERKVCMTEWVRTPSSFNIQLSSPALTPPLSRPFQSQGLQTEGHRPRSARDFKIAQSFPRFRPLHPHFLPDRVALIQLLLIPGLWARGSVFRDREKVSRVKFDEIKARRSDLVFLCRAWTSCCTWQSQRCHRLFFRPFIETITMVEQNFLLQI